MNQTIRMVVGSGDCHVNVSQQLHKQRLQPLHQTAESIETGLETGESPKQRTDEPYTTGVENHPKASHCHMVGLQHQHGGLGPKPQAGWGSVGPATCFVAAKQDLCMYALG
jgi:hypothetical protein